jgi:hypothetical protein
MLAVLNENYGKVVDIERFSSDGRLTEHSDGSVFDYHKMLEAVNLLGRPLTDKEAEIYRIK